MKTAKRKNLQRAGFKVGSVQDLLELSDEEMALIDLKIRLVRMLKTSREASGLTQQKLAKLIGSSQSRIARMEGGDPDVTLDLICKALFALGESRQSIGKSIGSKRAA